MARSVHVRLDDASTAALDVLRANGLTHSQAVRTALQEAAQRRRGRAALREEVEQLAADAADVAEMRAIREQMAGLVPSVTSGRVSANSSRQTVTAIVGRRARPATTLPR